MTKEEEIRELVKEKKFFEKALNTQLTRADTYKDTITKINKKINWLSHLIRKGE